MALFIPVMLKLRDVSLYHLGDWAKKAVVLKSGWRLRLVWLCCGRGGDSKQYYWAIKFRSKVFSWCWNVLEWYCEDINLNRVGWLNGLCFRMEEMCRRCSTSYVFISISIHLGRGKWCKMESHWKSYTGIKVISANVLYLIWMEYFMSLCCLSKWILAEILLH